MDASIEQRLSTLEDRVAKLEAAISAPDALRRSVATKKMSAKEFLLTRTFKSEVEKTLLLAYYLERMEGMSSFNINDVVGVFQSAKEKKPSNPSDVVAKNVARGFFMEAAGKKDGKMTWTLTSTGERYVEDELKK